MKSFFRISQKEKHIIASNKINTDPRNKTKSLSGRCIQYPFILGNDVLGSIVYFRKQESEPFTQEEICTISGPYSKYISSVLLDWHNKSIKFGNEMWEFISIMSHEMRTPLNGISGMTQLLIDSGNNLTSNQRKYVQILQDSNVHLLGLVNDMIDYSKLQYKQINLHKDSLSLSLIIEQSINILDAKKDHTIAVNHTKPNYDLILSDKSKLLQIFINLLGNALKYTPSLGKINIETNIIFPKDGMSILEYIIKDNGIGMSDEDIEHIFEPFFKSEKVSENNNYKGMGLGLSIVRDILTYLGGTINVKSSINKGSEFKVSIPVELDNYFDNWYLSKRDHIEKLNIILFMYNKIDLQNYMEVLENNSIKYKIVDNILDLKGVDILITDTYDYNKFKNHSKTNIINTHEIQPIRNILFPHICEQTTITFSKKDLKTLRILLVEDDKTNQFYVQEVLKGLGIDTTQITAKVCQKDAISHINKENYDIYMLDVKLPDGNGKNIAQTIQRTKSGKYQIIGMTAGVQENNNGSFDKFITKPLKRTTLASILKEHFA